MAEKNTLKEIFRFDRPGTLPRPGPIGRLVRLVVGVLCLSLVWDLVVHGGPEDLAIPAYWIWVGIGLLLVPYVVNIGFGVRWGAWPRWVSLAGIGLAAAGSWALAGEPAGDPLWWTTNAWLAYVIGHLGLSFVLSALIATPGCEMRAIPHLLGLFQGQDAREHYCPGFIDAVDRWERGDLEPDGQQDNDLLGSPGRLLLFYGVPFLALQLAGNLGGPLVGNGVPALAFLFVGLGCAVNALRVRRVHCILLAPLFLTAGVAMALLTFGLIDFGPGTWPLIVNTALAGGFLVGCGSEHLWGRYLGEQDKG